MLWVGDSQQLFNIFSLQPRVEKHQITNMNSVYMTLWKRMCLTLGGVVGFWDLGILRVLPTHHPHVGCAGHLNT